jgi:hypothetical protein
VSASRSQPSPGDADFRATIAAIAKRNQAAQVEAVRRRATTDAATARDAARLARVETCDLPRRPGR